jgi:homoserine O-acetyltransferase
MDLHDIGRGRDGVEKALQRVRVPTLTVSIDSDGLYFPYQQEEIRDVLHAHGTPVDHAVIHSEHGHDAFLLETEQVSDAVAGFLADVEKHHD